jgi:hypothetical protein
MTATLLDMVGQDRRGRGVCELVTKPLADRAAQTGLRWRVEVATTRHRDLADPVPIRREVTVIPCSFCPVSAVAIWRLSRCAGSCAAWAIAPTAGDWART